MNDFVAAKLSKPLANDSREGVDLRTVWAIYGHDPFVYDGRVFEALGVDMQAPDRLFKAGLACAETVQFGPDRDHLARLFRIAPSVYFDDSTAMIAQTRIMDETVARPYTLPRAVSPPPSAQRNEIKWRKVSGAMQSKTAFILGKDAHQDLIKPSSRLAPLWREMLPLVRIIGVDPSVNFDQNHVKDKSLL